MGRDKKNPYFDSTKRKLVPTKKACEILGCHPNTVRKWADEGKILCIRSPHNRRLYDCSSFMNREYMEEKKSYIYCYSESKRSYVKSDAMVNEMKAVYPNHTVIRDVSSKMPQLISLLDDCWEGKVGDIVFACTELMPDACFEIFKWVLRRSSVNVIYFKIEDNKSSKENHLLTLLSALKNKSDNKEKE